MEDFLKNQPTLLEVLQFTVQDHPEKEKYARELIGWTYLPEIVDLILELRIQPGCQDYGFDQGFARFRISRREASRLIKWIKNHFSEEVEIKDKVGDTSYGFKKNGDQWDISYGGIKQMMRNLKGVVDIAYLVSRPFLGYEAISLVMRDDKQPEPTYLNSMTQEQLEEEGLSKGPLVRKTTVRLPDKERGIKWKELQKYDAEIEEAKMAGDFALEKEIRDGRDELLDELIRSNKASGEVKEKARKRVDKRIQKAIKEIRKQNGDLADHLAKAIKIGNICRYTPDPPITWDVKF